MSTLRAYADQLEVTDGQLAILVVKAKVVEAEALLKLGRQAMCDYLESDDAIFTKLDKPER